MTGRLPPFAPNGAYPIQTVICAAGIPSNEVAAPSMFAGECKEKRT